jgi:hypothetical protein
MAERAPGGCTRRQQRTRRAQLTWSLQRRRRPPEGDERSLRSLNLSPVVLAGAHLDATSGNITFKSVEIFYLVSRRFRAGFALVSRWFRAGFAQVSRRFRAGFALVSRRFRAGFALVSRGFARFRAVLPMCYHKVSRSIARYRIAFAGYRASYFTVHTGYPRSVEPGTRCRAELRRVWIPKCAA